MTQTAYDTLGRPIWVYTTDPAITADANGGSQTGGSATVDFGPYGTQRAAVSRVQYSGLSTTTLDDRQRSRTEVKNPDGKTVLVTDAWGAEILYQHDPLGNLIQTLDPLGNQVTVTYDDKGRKTRLQDPDSGDVGYCYDALGQLKAQQNSEQRHGHGATTCSNATPGSAWTLFSYDRLGRITSRIEPEYTSSWTYDRDAQGSSCAAGGTSSFGKLCQSSTSQGVSRRYVYDNLGRPQSTRTDISGGPSMATAVSYGANGRLATQTYPTGVQLSYEYTVLGFLRQLSGQGQMLWQAQRYNAWGRAELQSYGNGVQTSAVYEARSGRLLGHRATNAGNTAIVHQRLGWDSVDQLTSRIDGIASVQDNYGYDPIGRLIQHEVLSGGSPLRTVALSYNAIGLMLSKSDVGSYRYPTQGGPLPHAVQNVGTGTAPSYFYDLNGNAIIAGNAVSKWQALRYTSFNLPGGNDADGTWGLQGTNVAYRWQYDENHARIRETHQNSQGIRSTWYLHPDNLGGLAFEREESPKGTAYNRHYVSVGGSVIAVAITQGALPDLGTGTAPPQNTNVTVTQLQYWHKDHLGSLIATTDPSGNATARYSYDPFGKRRFNNGVYDAAGQIVIDWDGAGSNAGPDRGYTGHEHLDDVGVIHMNGRTYDSTIARFMQADPVIQNPVDLQNYDRFGYCLNNPGTCTDPSGYFSQRFLRLLDPGGLKRRIAGTSDGYKIGSILITVGSYWCSYAAAICNGFGQAAWAGYAGAAGTDQERVGWRAGINTAANQFIGQIFTDSYWNTIAHVAWGCVYSDWVGGDCGSGARGAFVGEIAGGLEYRDSTANAAYVATVNLLIRSTAGGLASMAGGGKFSEGAESAAYAYLFNSLAHPKNTYEAGVRQAILRGDVQELRTLLGNGVLSADDALIAQRALTAMESLGAENSAMLAGRYGVDWANKVGHAFGKEMHNLGGLVEKFGSAERGSSSFRVEPDFTPHAQPTPIQRGCALTSGLAGKWLSLPRRRNAMAMKLAAVRKPRAARLACCIRPFMASTKALER